MRSWILAALAALTFAGAARAEVVDTGPQGFRLKIVRQVAASNAKVAHGISQVGHWWDSDHTYSGRAENMTLDVNAGGCWCETIPPGGSVRHGVVALNHPQQGMIRIDTALGPLQDEGVSGSLTFLLKPKDGGTELTVTYNVGGARDFVVGFAPNVDKVLTAATDRLKRYVETGKPTP